MPHVGHGVPHIGNDIDNRTAAVIPHPLGIALAAEQKAAGQIIADHGFPAVEGDIFQQGRELPARVIHQAMDGPMLLDDIGNGIAHGFFIADIASMNGGLAAFFGQFLLDGFKLVHGTAN